MSNCKICVVDDSFPNFKLDKNGICNYCNLHFEMEKDMPNEEGHPKSFICNYKKEIEQAVQKVITSKDRVNLEVPVIATVPEKLGNEPVAEFKITLSMKEK